MRILSIGNSFADDAQEFLHDIAAADGVDLEVCNLYIGGCSLETHWKNACSGAVCYDYRRNGKNMGRMSLEGGLLDGTWDWITL